MKKIWLGLCLLVPNGLAGHDNNKQVEVDQRLCLGRIEGVTADFCVLYAGQRIDVGVDGLFTLKIAAKESLALLFCDPQKITFTCQDQTVLKQSVSTSDYKYYKLTLCGVDWQMDQQTLSGPLPLQTIIVPLSPSQVEIALQDTSSTIGQLTLELPTIKLVSKSKIPVTQLLTEGYLKVIDLSPFYVKQRVHSINYDNAKISIYF